MTKTKKIVVTGLMVALAVVLPVAFHSVPNAGKIFLPMHVPVLLAGFIVGPIYGLICGVLSPLLSSLITGMPPIAMLPAMVLELASYGFFSGLFVRLIKSPSAVLNIYLSLITSMLIGRLLSGVINATLLQVGKYSIKIWLTASFVTALPGILIQLALIPILIFTLKRTQLINWDDEDVWGLSAAKPEKATN
jgi:Protein of unknown function (DUF1393).